MSVVVLLFLIGVLLLGVEVFVPGGVLGVLGGIAMVSGCVIAFTVFGINGGLIASGIAAAILCLTFYVEFVLLPKTSLGRSLTVRVPSLPPADESAKHAALIGQMASAETILAPTGYVLVGGVRYEAVSQTGLIQRGTTVSIVAYDGFRLIVSSKTKNI